MCGIHCGMLFRVIHVQSLIRDILHVGSESGRERKRVRKGERKKERDEKITEYIDI